MEYCLSHFSAFFHQLLFCLSFGTGGVNQFQVGSHGFAVFVRDVAQGIANHVNNAQLHARFGKHGFNGIGKARQSITASKEDVFQTAILNFAQNR